MPQKQRRRATVCDQSPSSASSKTAGASQSSWDAPGSWVDDEDVAVRPAGDALADAASEQPLQESRLAGAGDDQIRFAPLCDLDDLLGGLADDAGELVPDAGLEKERLDARAVLLPDRLVPLYPMFGGVEVVRREPERPGHRAVQRLGRCDVGDDHDRVERLCQLGGARQGALGRMRPVVPDHDRLHRRVAPQRLFAGRHRDRRASISSHLPILERPSILRSFASS
jgi:hypothetical protein